MAFIRIGVQSQFQVWAYLVHGITALSYRNREEIQLVRSMISTKLSSLEAEVGSDRENTSLTEARRSKLGKTMVMVIFLHIADTSLATKFAEETDSVRQNAMNDSIFPNTDSQLERLWNVIDGMPADKWSRAQLNSVLSMYDLVVSGRGTSTYEVVSTFSPVVGQKRSHS